jgi:hypothetical protein
MPCFKEVPALDKQIITEATQCIGNQALKRPLMSLSQLELAQLALKVQPLVYAMPHLTQRCKAERQIALRTAIKECRKRMEKDNKLALQTDPDVRRKRARSVLADAIVGRGTKLTTEAEIVAFSC